MFPDAGAGYHHHQTGGSSAALVESKLRSTRGRRRRRRKAGGGGGASLDRIEESGRFINFASGGYDQQRHDKHQQDEDKPPPPCTEFDLAYFHSYAHLGIHEEMIKDRVRTDTYRAAIMQHQSAIAGKVVVDVGCGTGILSIFCAQAGAERVYAVDASDIAVQGPVIFFRLPCHIKSNDITHSNDGVWGQEQQKITTSLDPTSPHGGSASVAREVVKANNLSDRVIVLHGRVEDVEIDEEVDVIISEWMGYMLLYESMLGSVITARDRWLKPGGLILPSNATLYMTPITNTDRYAASVDFWRDVYGIDMSAMVPLAKQCAFEEPCIETITGENVLTWPHVVKHVDCYTVTVEELESVTARYSFKSMMRAPLHGFAFWFDVEFSGQLLSPNNNYPGQSFVEASTNQMAVGSQKKKRTSPADSLMLSTAPEDPPTHWQQTMIYFYEPIELEQDQLITGSLTLSQSKENRRFMNIHLEYATGGRSFVKESVMR